MTTLGHALALIAVLGGQSAVARAADEPAAAKDRPRPILVITELHGLLGIGTMREVHGDGTLVWRDAERQVRAQVARTELSELQRQLDLEATRSAIESLRWRHEPDALGVGIDRGTVNASVQFDHVPKALWPVIWELERLFMEHFGDYTPLHYDGRSLPQGCPFWRALLDASEAAPTSSEGVDELDEAATLDAMRCLLDLKGNQHRARSGGVARFDVSPSLPLATVEIAALSYVSYLFDQRWDHAGVVALLDKDGRLNEPRAVRIAYFAYHDWLRRVELMGLARARQKRLQPFENTTIGWYSR